MKMIFNKRYNFSEEIEFMISIYKLFIIVIWKRKKKKKKIKLKNINLIIKKFYKKQKYQKNIIKSICFNRKKYKKKYKNKYEV